MRNKILTGFAALALVSSFWLGHLTAPVPEPEPAPAPAPVFPCVEDEVFTHWPGYEGPTCIHWEVLEARVRERDRSR